MVEVFKKLRKISFQKRGFSLIELLTSVGIVGVLSVVGIKTYQAQTNKSRTAEAKYLLSAVFSAEKNFKDVWGTYHENLIVIGAIPEGVYHYDVGFGKTSTTTLSKTDGSLDNPRSPYPSPASLQVEECTNFYQICLNTTPNCLSKSPKATGAAYTYHFYGDPNAGTASALKFNCKVTGQLYVKDYGSVVDRAGETTFTAIARSKLKSDDVWSVNQEKTFEHVLDGTK